MATSALRNLNKQLIRTRELKVSFGKDQQSGTNLKPDEVRERDASEILSNTGGNANADPGQLEPEKVLLP